jgi:hypothetical protein
MPRTHIVLYRQLLQTLRRMDRAGLPCTGCVGMPQASQVLCPATYMRQVFRTDSSSDVNSRLTGELGDGASLHSNCCPASSVCCHSPYSRSRLCGFEKVRVGCTFGTCADAFQALRMLPKQLAVLQASEEDTRQVRNKST